MTARIKTVLITGGAKRIGRQMAQTLHAAGHNVVVHYRSSANAAAELADLLNKERAGSAATVQGDLLDIERLSSLVDEAVGAFGRLDLLFCQSWARNAHQSFSA